MYLLVRGLVAGSALFAALTLLLLFAGIGLGSWALGLMAIPSVIGAIATGVGAGFIAEEFKPKKTDRLPRHVQAKLDKRKQQIAINEAETQVSLLEKSSHYRRTEATRALEKELEKGEKMPALEPTILTEAEKRRADAKLKKQEQEEKRAEEERRSRGYY